MKADALEPALSSPTGSRQFREHRPETWISISRANVLNTLSPIKIKISRKALVLPRLPPLNRVGHWGTPRVGRVRRFARAGNFFCWRARAPVDNFDSGSDPTYTDDRLRGTTACKPQALTASWLTSNECTPLANAGRPKGSPSGPYIPMRAEENATRNFLLKPPKGLALSAAFFSPLSPHVRGTWPRSLI